MFARTAFRRAVAAAVRTSAPCRRYAQTHANHPQGGSSDLPWIIGSVAFTVPAAWYLVKTGPSKPAHKHEHKKEEAKPEPEPEPIKEEVKEAVAEVPQKAEEVKEKAEEKVEEVKEKGEEKFEEAKEAVSERKEEEEPKSSTVNPQKIDPGNTATKEAGGPGTISGKQEGLSNDDTSHAILHEERGDAISKKAEGVHDTAKLKGTVDVDRPAK
ncbi:hypothetical protein FN846DRAFT_925665 [Sphaerosporella brunnea]|uniref:Uncharacterized protein n=1 Tax=Sphaerosporella brunnea TaxID=1250544 RepID=A0A5J5FBV5_9PEZI|nr:hypothetical protein FN846DRAFT_925665 [Sphaerosporella brunnea]